jgi:hypothetical protein
MFDLAVNLSPWNRWMATGGTVLLSSQQCSGLGFGRIAACEGPDPAVPGPPVVRVQLALAAKSLV